MRFVFPTALALWATAALPQTTAAEINLARDGLSKTIAQLYDGPAAPGFELGMLQTLRAVEKTLQARYKYGLGESMADLPLLRLEFAGLDNPAPAPSTPGTLSAMVDGFVTDLAQARESLESAESAGILPFDLALGDIWFDINANGTREQTETAVAILGEAVLGRQAFEEFTNSDMARRPPVVRFDEADHAWLLAYTHMLSGFGNFFLAFDPEPVLRDLAAQRTALADAPQIPNYYDLDAVRAEIAKLEAEKKEGKRRLDEAKALQGPIREEMQILRDKLNETDDAPLKADLQARIARLRLQIDQLKNRVQQLRQASRLIRNELQAANQKLPQGTDPMRSMFKDEQASIDILYVALTALSQKPDAARIRAAHDHIRAMIAHNRVFWARLAQETDNDREWIPNASQGSVLPITIPPRLAESWQNILRDIEAVLDGRLLIPHWLLPDGHGISLPAYVNDPSPLELVGWVHGIAAYPYAARGPRLSTQNWRAFQRLSLGNAGGFALLFN